MKNSERVTPVAAIISAFLSMACCLPIALPLALGAAGLGVVLETLRPWFLGLSLGLLGAGFVQLFRKRACGRRSAASLVLLGIATVVVLGFAFFPQLVASLLAGSP